MTGSDSIGSARKLSAKLRSAIEDEFGARARPLEAVLVALDERAQDVDAADDDARRRELDLLTPLLDRIEDSLDVLRLGG